SRRRHTRFSRDWSSDVCSSDLSSITDRMSTLSTGFPSRFFQPLRFHPGIHLVTELITYCESHKMRSSSSARCDVDASKSATAINSPRLFVLFFHPPAAHVSSSMYQDQPAGPGLPRAEPSAAAMIVMAADCNDAHR